MCDSKTGMHDSAAKTSETKMSHLRISITRHQIRLPSLNNTLHLEHYKTSSPHIPATPSEHSVASSGSQDSSPGTPSEQYTLRHQPRHPLWTLCCIFEDQPSDLLWTPRRPLRIARHQPRHPLWAICCILSIITRHQPRAPSEKYVAPWASQDINPAIPSLKTMLHLQHHARESLAFP